jgi:hypothetical protein
VITRSYCAVIRERHHAKVPSEESAMYSVYEGLPAAASVQQAVCLAQLEILRRLERQRTGAAPAGR